MTYKITITKMDLNPNYKEEYEDYREKSRYGSAALEPIKNIESRVLDVELTEEEYKKVKAEVIKVFE